MGEKKSKTLYITIPQYDGTINTFLAIELVKQQQMIYEDEKYKDIQMIVEILNFESLITRQRNTQFATFLKNGYDVWLMIDSDITFSAKDILDMYEKVQKYKVVQYPYRIKDPENFRLVITGFKKIDYPMSIVEQAGTGILAIHREVQEKLQKFQKLNNLQYTHNDLELYDLFQARIGEIETQKVRTYLSEDWTFCKYIELVGYDIYLDLSVTTHHITKNFFFTYSPDMIEIEKNDIKNKDNTDKKQKIDNKQKDNNKEN